MKVILREDIESLGKMGAIIKVADGYARNYLIPKGLAIEANVKNVRFLEHEKRGVTQRAEKERKRAEALVDTFKGLTCTVARRVGKQDKLFGSVTTKDIEKSLRDQGMGVDRKNIILEEPLKSLGEFPVKIRLYPGVVADITVAVVKEAE
jgi:large subunit ribosomal protein L9